MKVGIHTEGRNVEYMESTGTLTMNDTFVTIEQVLEYSDVDRIIRTDDEIRAWKQEFGSPVPPLLPAASVPGWIEPQAAGWVTCLLIWANALIFPISVPHGSLTMWKNNRISQPLRIAMTVAGLILLIAFLMDVTKDDAMGGTCPEEVTHLKLAISLTQVESVPASESEPQVARQAEPNLVHTETELPTYSVYDVEDVSLDSVKRYKYHVVVPQYASVEQLEEIADHVFDEAKLQTPFNALNICFNDYPEYIGYGCTLGVVEYAPNGDWAAAMDVRTGDYSIMLKTSELKELDWSKRLTPEEVKIWRDWQDECMKRESMLAPDDMEGVDEKAVSADIGARYGISAVEVDAVLKKELSWEFQ
ncbi:MAG: hypothetical protein WAR22_09370 [Desulfomonilia bacterium]|jgi:hypothetical protein